MIINNIIGVSEVKKRITITNRICEICHKKIYRIQIREFDVRTNLPTSEWLETWSNYYTCCKDCMKIREKKRFQLGTINDEYPDAD